MRNGIINHSEMSCSRSLENNRVCNSRLKYYQYACHIDFQSHDDHAIS